MSGICIGAVLFFGVVAALAVFGAIIIMAHRMHHGGLPHKTRRFHDDETAAIQQTFSGLSRMEKRVEALETILLDK